MLARLPSIDNSRCKCLAGNLRNVSIDVFNAGNTFGRTSYALHIGFVISHC